MSQEPLRHFHPGGRPGHRHLHPLSPHQRLELSLEPVHGLSLVLYRVVLRVLFRYPPPLPPRDPQVHFLRCRCPPVCECNCVGPGSHLYKLWRHKRDREHHQEQSPSHFRPHATQTRYRESVLQSVSVRSWLQNETLQDL